MEVRQRVLQGLHTTTRALYKPCRKANVWSCSGAGVCWAEAHGYGLASWAHALAVLCFLYFHSFGLSVFEPDHRLGVHCCKVSLRWYYIGLVLLLVELEGKAEVYAMLPESYIHCLAVKSTSVQSSTYMLGLEQLRQLNQHEMIGSYYASTI